MYDILLRLMDMNLDSKSLSRSIKYPKDIIASFNYGLNGPGYYELKIFIWGKADTQHIYIEMDRDINKFEIYSLSEEDILKDNINHNFIQINRDDIINQELNTIFCLTHGRKFTDRWFLDHFKKYRDFITKEEILKFLDGE